ncbi:MAG: replicative DNA helicase [Firmicutes bacterium]|nr:replicative DNA helicase [Bacillota bacterium]
MTNLPNKNFKNNPQNNKPHPNLSARVLPHSVEAESSVLGCILIDENAPIYILGELSATDFYMPSHRTIFSAMASIALKDKPIDIVTLVTELEALGSLDEAGGLTYLNNLSNLVPSSANFRHYTTIVKKTSTLRRLIEASGRIADKAFTGDPDDTAINFAEGEIFSLAEKFDRSKLVHASEPLSETIAEIEFKCKNPDSGRGIPTGFKRLDKMLNGWQKGDLVIIAARPSEGKTSLGMNFITKAMFDGNRRTSAGKPDPYKCAVFSLEMPSSQLLKRLVCSHAKVNMERVNAADLNAKEWKKLFATKTLVDKAHLYIDDSSLTTPIEILSKCRRLKREKGLDFIMIDYLQLMSSGKRVENRQQEVSDITRTLKIAAKELGVPIILLSQMSRDIEKRKGADKMPQMSDLRESGAIEQDADIILFIHRKYASTDLSVSEEERNRVQLVIAKHRNGERGLVDVKWKGETVTFEDVEFTSSYVPPQDSGGGNFTVSEDFIATDNNFELNDNNYQDSFVTPNQKSTEELLAVPLSSDEDEVF